jgi:hypothetical protein
MKVLKGNYIKESGEERKVGIYILNKDNNYVTGIDTTSLTEAELEEFKSIVKEYEDKMKPFIKKAFKKYKTNNFSGVNEVEI